LINIIVKDNKTKERKIMFTFYYNTTKSFDQPGPNQPKGAITTYYKASEEDLQELSNYVYSYYKDMEADYMSNPGESVAVYERPLQNHRKKNKQYYTVKDVIIDLNNQLEKGKDPTESMLNRWNSAFCELGVSEACIMLKLGPRPLVKDRTRIPNDLFNEFFEEDK
jgi:hypothetical protein